MQRCVFASPAASRTGCALVSSGRRAPAAAGRATSRRTTRRGAGSTGGSGSARAPGRSRSFQWWPDTWRDGGTQSDGGMSESSASFRLFCVRACVCICDRPGLVAVPGFELSSDLKDDPRPVRRGLHLEVEHRDVRAQHTTRP